MSTKFLTLSLVALLCGACHTGPKLTAADYDMNSPKMQAAWAEYMTPGPAHKVLDTKVGKWDVKVTMFNPDGSSSNSTGTSEFAWVMDGHYLQENVTGEFGGAPFHGQGTTAYDNMLKHYTFTWIDSMGTGIMTGHGTYDAAKKMFTFESKSPDLLKGKYTASHSTETILDRNHIKSEMWGEGPDGKQVKMMELVYTRKSS